MDIQDLQNLTVKEIIHHCREIGIKRYSKKKKADLIDYIMKWDQAAT